jgi:hypothetical protein
MRLRFSITSPHGLHPDFASILAGQENLYEMRSMRQDID